MTRYRSPLLHSLSTPRMLQSAVIECPNVETHVMLSALSEGFFLQLAFSREVGTQIVSSRFESDVTLLHTPAISFGLCISALQRLWVFSSGLFPHPSRCVLSSFHMFHCSEGKKREYTVCTLKIATSGSCSPCRLSLRRHVCTALSRKKSPLHDCACRDRKRELLRLCNGAVHHIFQVDVAPSTVFR